MRGFAVVDCRNLTSTLRVCRPTEEAESESDEEMDVDANLCCPDALSAVLSCLCFPAWLRSLRVFDQNERAAVPGC